MGVTLIDKYSLLHFAAGITAQFWGTPLVPFLAGAAAFELLENTDAGMRLIRQLPFWPGGKDRADHPLNMVGDVLFAALGWLLADWVN